PPQHRGPDRVQPGTRRLPRGRPRRRRTRDRRLRPATGRRRPCSLSPAPAGTGVRIERQVGTVGRGMCGFSGEIDLTRAAADPVAVAHMTGTMSDRGPDGTGFWAQGPVALGHRRLKIIDLSERGAQPMVDPVLGLAIAFNGCIYNHLELRRELESHGYRFFSASDTEVLLKAYHRWGDGFVHRLVGMFALCIVERDSGRALLVRDRLG